LFFFTPLAYASKTKKSQHQSFTPPALWDDCEITSDRGMQLILLSSADGKYNAEVYVSTPTGDFGPEPITASTPCDVFHQLFDNYLKAKNHITRIELLDASPFVVVADMQQVSQKSLGYIVPVATIL
jgi:hypothetical protein